MRRRSSAALITVLGLLAAAGSREAAAESVSESYRMEYFVSSTAVVATDGQGIRMFSTGGGPAFGFGIDSAGFRVYPLDPGLFTVPVTISAFELD